MSAFEWFMFLTGCVFWVAAALGIVIGVVYSSTTAISWMFEWKRMKRLVVDPQFRMDIAEAALGTGVDESFHKTLYKLVRNYKHVQRERRKNNKKASGL